MEFNLKTLICCEIIGYIILNSTIIITKPNNHTIYKLIVTYLSFSIVINLMWLLVGNIKENIEKIGNELCNYFRLDPSEIIEFNSSDVEESTVNSDNKECNSESLENESNEVHNNDLFKSFCDDTECVSLNIKNESSESIEDCEPINEEVINRKNEVYNNQQFVDFIFNRDNDKQQLLDLILNRNNDN